jgi:hypothetical protein
MRTAMVPGGEPIPSLLQFDASLVTLSGQPTEDALGTTIIIITVTDLLQGKASIAVILSVERDTWETFVFVATILGYIGSAVGPLIAEYAYRIFLMNLLRGAKNRLSCSIAFRDSNVFHMVFPEVDTVQAYYIIWERQLDCQKALDHYEVQLLPAPLSVASVLDEQGQAPPVVVRGSRVVSTSHRRRRHL